MTTRRKTTTGKGAVKKLKFKKETIKDLAVKGKGKEIKGGRGNTLLCTLGCPKVTDATCLRCG